MGTLEIESRLKVGLGPKEEEVGWAQIKDITFYFFRLGLHGPNKWINNLWPPSIYFPFFFFFFKWQRVLLGSISSALSPRTLAAVDSTSCFLGYGKDFCLTSCISLPWPQRWLKHGHMPQVGLISAPSIFLFKFLGKKKKCSFSRHQHGRVYILSY